MKKLIFGLLLIAVTLFSSCSKEDNDWEVSLKGTTWTNVKRVKNTETGEFRTLTTTLNFQSETFNVIETKTNPAWVFENNGTYVHDISIVKLVISDTNTKIATVCGNAMTLTGDLYTQE